MRIDGTALQKRFIGDRSFYREVIAISLPIILQQLITTLMGIADNIMVGQISSDVLASVTVANKYFMITQSVMFGITGGICIFISQYYGAEDHDKVQGLFLLNMLGALTVAGISTAILLAFPRQLLGIFLTSDHTIAYGLEYLGYVVFSYLPFAVSLACMTALRSIGYTKAPLMISIGAVFLNVGLNYALIFGKFGLPRMGVAGAALATLIARIVEMLLFAAVISSGREYFTFSTREFRVMDKKLLRQIWSRALPLLGNEILWSTGTTSLFWAYSFVHEPFIAALAIVEMSSGVAFVIFGGLGVSISVMIGKRLGAGLFDEAKANAGRLIVFACGFSLLMTLGMFLLAPAIPHLFNTSEAIRLMATQLLRTQALFYIVITINVSCFLIFRAGGDTKSAMAIDSGFVWFFSLPLAVFLALVVKPPLPLFYLIIQSCELLKMVIAVRYLKRGRWVVNLT
jgi:putative MATE family efflux protein